VFRINMSHTSHEAMRKLHAAIRAVEAQYGRRSAFSPTCQGPKLRGRHVHDRLRDLKKGATFTLDDDKTPGDENRVYLPHPEISRRSSPGIRCCSTTAR